MYKKLSTIALIAITSFNFTVAQTTNPSPYCDASFDDAQGFPVDDHINSVSFGALNNVTNSQYAAPHYVFYNNLTTQNFTKGSTYTLTVNFTTAGGCGYGVWIDYNHNNIFEASEKIAGTTGTTMLAVGATPTITQSVTIPTSAMTGNTRMRVRIVEDDNYNLVTTNELPCNASTSDTDVMDWGETEDYTINISTTTGINEVNESDGFSIYPNPATSFIALNHSTPDNVTFKIFNHIGQVIQEGSISNSDKQINVVSLAEGIYFLQLFDEKKHFGMKKFIKKAN